MADLPELAALLRQRSAIYGKFVALNSRFIYVY